MKKLIIPLILLACLIIVFGCAGDGEIVAIILSYLYFPGYDETYGTELWKSDGTLEGTVMVKDIYTGANGSSPMNFTNVNGTLYFSADDGTNGYELWKSDGTADGTVMVKDIDPRVGDGPYSSYPSSLINFNGTLYFNAGNGTYGGELWKSDGTDAGTILVKDINSGSTGSEPWYLTNFNGTLYFRADDGTNGSELWKSDGTDAGTVMVKDIDPRVNDGPYSSYPAYLTNVNGTLFFAADDGTHGYEPWISDGTAAGTVMVMDVLEGPGSGFSIPR